MDRRGLTGNEAQKLVDAVEELVEAIQARQHDEWGTGHTRALEASEALWCVLIEVFSDV